MAIIRASVLELLGEANVHSILLTGGFGRGEGGVYPSAGGWHIVNDYDLLVVPQVRSRLGYANYYRRNHGRLEQPAERLAAQFGMKQVDLALKHRRYFTHPDEFRIENYETRCGHHLVYGDEDLCALMPSWRAEDLPLVEGAKLFRNRGLGLLLARLYLTTGGALLLEDRENFFIEYNKARLAMGDGILLLRRRYHHLYSQRLHLVQHLPVGDIPSGAKVIAGYREALIWKLQPDERALDLGDPLGAWRAVAGEFQRFFLFYESQRLGRPVVCWRDYAAIPKSEDRTNLRAFLGEILRSWSAGVSKTYVRQRLLKANLARTIELIGVLLAAATELERGPCLDRAAWLLGLPRSGDDNQDLLATTLAALRTIHPGGAVAKILQRHAQHGRESHLEVSH